MDYRQVICRKSERRQAAETVLACEKKEFNKDRIG